MKKIGNVQIGKQGITEKFIESLKNHFKNSENIKISVLKNATRDRNEIKNLSNKILEKLGKKYTSRIIGFTIILKKWRRNVR
jgi:RNA-binding protein YhbY|tara:strand:- start:3313 stop:3558 length:246 start_codon:yes stop_codon:yes gene_type:complete